MRILMGLPMPWDRQLGGARIHVELAEEMQALGHTVERFTIVDAFGSVPAGRRLRNGLLLFPRRLAAHVRRHPGRWDVIDAFEGDVPYGKQHLRHDGLLVCRSLGARASYHDFMRAAQRRWPEEGRRGKLYLRPWRSWEARRLVELGDRSARAADLVLVPNRDEEQLFAARLGLGERTVRVPFGLTDERMTAFATAAEPPVRRHSCPRLAFVGTWTSRKGARELPEILRRLQAVRPDIALGLLGVSTPSQRVRAEMGDPAGLEIVEHFTSADLPGLLATATVGVFPSYVEGFGFAVLEKLAAGVPVVAYDAPGPREMLSETSWPGLTPPGDLDAFTNAVFSILDAPVARYAQMSAEAERIAQRFRWPAIARQTVDLYEQGLRKLAT